MVTPEACVMESSVVILLLVFARKMKINAERWPVCRTVPWLLSIVRRYEHPTRRIRCIRIHVSI